MILIIDCGSKKVKNFKLPVLTKIIKLGQKENFNNFLGIIISGAPILLTEVDQRYYLDQFAWLKKMTIPVLGVCFGHQIIGLLHGSKITKGDEVREEQEIFVLKEDGLFANLEKRIYFQEDHCEHLTLPPNFTLLATSEKSKVEAMKFKNFYGVQFHPEVSGKNGNILLENFVKICLD